jgi:hypothetical protein
VMSREINECNMCFKQNIEKGITQELYRKDLDVDVYVKFYYTLIFSINENTRSEKEAQKLELDALEYHTRAMATPKGIAELEVQLSKTNI